MRKLILRQSIRSVLDAVPRIQRRHKEAIFRARWYFHAVLDIVYILEQATLTANNNVVDRRQLLRILCLDMSLAAEYLRAGGEGKLANPTPPL